MGNQETSCDSNTYSFFLFFFGGTTHTHSFENYIEISCVHILVGDEISADLKSRCCKSVLLNFCFVSFLIE